ncbi:MAG: aminotransferase class I/II-fold pyridoxal phosphate-dependent enzyme, partial [Anaerolineales bacterium]
MSAQLSNDQPVFAVPENTLVPVSDHLSHMSPIPPSRMFLINKSLKVYSQKNPGSPVFDASQGDGGASLPGVPKELLQRAAELQVAHGTAYDMPYGSEDYRRSVVEQYWKLEPDLGYGTANILGAVGGRDALVKAYQAMLSLGHGRQGDALVVSRVPWISYNWGPYGIGANVLYAPGDPENGWAYSEDGLRDCVAYAAKSGRKIAGLVITNPDNPTGLTVSAERQVSLAKTALQAGAAYVLFDWMYHYITDEKPMDLNVFL